MEIVQFGEGPTMGSNSYILFDNNSKQAVIVDPSHDDNRYEDFLDKQGLKLEKILLTHGHFDHIAGIKRLKDKYNAKIIIPEKDKDLLTKPHLNLSASLGQSISAPPADQVVSEGETINLLPGVTVSVLETPGHTPGSACYLGDDFLIAGDVLFDGSIGRTDFPGGSYSQMQQSLARLMQLDDNISVLPGHGPVTTIGKEKRSNPFIN